MDMQYIHRVGVQAAFRTARELYPTETDQQCRQRVADELCIDVQAVEDSLKPAEGLSE